DLDHRRTPIGHDARRRRAGDPEPELDDTYPMQRTRHAAPYSIRRPASWNCLCAAFFAAAQLLARAFREVRRATAVHIARSGTHIAYLPRANTRATTWHAGRTRLRYGDRADHPARWRVRPERVVVAAASALR